MMENCYVCNKFIDEVQKTIEYNGQIYCPKCFVKTIKKDITSFSLDQLQNIADLLDFGESEVIK